jgi:hypothetical protein
MASKRQLAVLEQGRRFHHLHAFFKTRSRKRFFFVELTLFYPSVPMWTRYLSAMVSSIMPYSRQCILTFTAWVTVTGSQARDRASPQRRLPWAAAYSEQQNVLQWRPCLQQKGIIATPDSSDTNQEGRRRDKKSGKRTINTRDWLKLVQGEAVHSKFQF